MPNYLPRYHPASLTARYTTASGLYYLSELVEEHTVLAKKLLTRLIYVVIALQLLLLAVDGFPLALSGLSIASHVVYAGNLRRFPIVKLTDPLFLLSCGTSYPPSSPLTPTKRKQSYMRE